MLLTLALVSCQKQSDIVTPTTGKMHYPTINLVQGSELVTKSAGNTITTLTYEFWVKAPNAGGTGTTGWVLAEDGLFKDGTTPQNNNAPTWDVAYPNNCTTCFIDIPLHMETRIVIKGKDADGIKYYGIGTSPVGGWTTAEIGNMTINMYEIDSRLTIDVSDLIKNTNFNFTLTFAGTIKPIDYNNIVQSTDSWLLGVASGVRNYRGVPLVSTTGVSVLKKIEILGTGIKNTTPTYKINDATATIEQVQNVYEYFGKGSSDFTATYSVVRRDGVVFKPTTAITMASPNPSTSFSGTNWLQAGYDFHIAFTANPQDLGKGCFVGTLTSNSTINGTVGL